MVAVERFVDFPTLACIARTEADRSESSRTFLADARETLKLTARASRLSISLTMLTTVGPVRGVPTFGAAPAAEIPNTGSDSTAKRKISNLSQSRRLRMRPTRVREHAEDRVGATPREQLAQLERNDQTELVCLLLLEGSEAGNAT